MRRTFEAVDEIVLRMIVRAAERGEKCPTNDCIAAAIGAASPSSGPTVLDRLARRGLITVERGNMLRVVTVLATGKRTAGVVKRDHWRFRPENAARRHIGYSARQKADKPIPVESPGPRLFREPCPRCGTRADYGCRHLIAPEVFA